jgi:hypothetical protein
MEAFTREVSVMMQVDHRHCVGLVGGYTDFTTLTIFLNPVADIDLAVLLDMGIPLYGKGT